MASILVTGAAGQIGTELVPALRRRYPDARILASDVKEDHEPAGDADYVVLDCTDGEAVNRVTGEGGVDTIYHLAAILSATAERIPQKAYRVNMDGLYNVLESARRNGCAVFTPSSIAAFGPDTPPDPTPQDTIQRPTTIYGVTKVAGELLCDYYHERFGVDARGVRYPGLISYMAPPGGGTTDYAVDIFYGALREGRYRCFLAEDTRLDMMYMPDALRAAVELMDADGDQLRHRNAFNVSAMQFTPAELAESIRGHIPDFRMEYDVDPAKQRIAESWPRRVDDSAARAEWGWCPEYDLERMTADMIDRLGERLGRTAGAVD